MKGCVVNHLADTNSSLQSEKSNRKTALVPWLKSINQSVLAVTITFVTGRKNAAASPSRHTTEEVIRKGIKRINTICYRNLAKRRGLSIGVVTVIEGGQPFKRIHAHLGFEPPPDMPLHQFCNLVTQVFKPSKWIERRPYIEKCWSQDWIDYMLKSGQESLAPSCCFKAKHFCA